MGEIDRAGIDAADFLPREEGVIMVLGVIGLVAATLLIMGPRPVRPRGHYAQQTGAIFAGTLAAAVTGQLPRERQYEEYRASWVETGDLAALERMLECVGPEAPPPARPPHPRRPAGPSWRWRLLPAAIGAGWLFSLLWVHRII